MTHRNRIGREEAEFLLSLNDELERARLEETRYRVAVNNAPTSARRRRHELAQTALASVEGRIYEFFASC